MGKAGALIGVGGTLVGLLATVATLYLSDTVDSQIVPQELMPLQETGGEMDYNCFNGGPCSATFTTLQGLLTFHNRGPSAAKNIDVYTRVLADRCEANVPGMQSGMQKGSYEAFVPAGEKFSAGLYTIYTDALRYEQTIDYCVVRKSRLPKLYYITRGRVYGPEGYGPVNTKDAKIPETVQISPDQIYSEEKTFFPERLCFRNVNPIRRCKPQSEVKPYIPSERGQELFAGIISDLLRPAPETVD